MTTRNARRGSVLIEFTAAIAFLLLFVAAIADLTRVFYYSDLVTTAAHAGTQYAIAAPGNAQHLDAIQAAATAEPGNLPGLTASAKQIPGPAEGRAYVQVTTQYQLHTVVSWPGFSNPVVLTGRATVRVE